MAQIQRGELSDGVRKRFRMSNDAAPDEMADAFSAVEVVENDRAENWALYGIRTCSCVGSSGPPGVGSFNFWQIHNPFGSGVLMSLSWFCLYSLNGISAGNTPQLLVDMNFADLAPIIGAKIGDGNFLDTRLALQNAGAQPLPAGQLWLQQAANIGGGAWRPLFRVPVSFNNTVAPFTGFCWPGPHLQPASRNHGIILAPNTTIVLNIQGADFANTVSQASFAWTERTMGELEGTFQNDTRKWIL